MGMARNRMLLLATVGGPTTAVVLLAAAGCGGGAAVAVKEFCLTAVLEPRWGGTAVAAEEIPGRPEDRSRIPVYTDVSAPLGGFLPLSGRGGQETSTLTTVAQLAGEHLLRQYGGGGVTIAWRGVGHDLGDLEPPRNLSRDDFNGRSTRLELALAEIFDDFQTGRAEVAAIVTDLMATDKIEGPLAVEPQVSDWLAGEDVRSGEFHLALLGVRADYWGVTHRQVCPERAGLGCWFSERNSEYRRLEGIESLPLYVLVAGRGLDRLEDVVTAIHRDLERLEVEVQWELLTASAKATEVSVTCTAFEAGGSSEVGQQFVLLEDEAGHRCARSALVELDCRFADEVELISVDIVEEAVAPEPTVDENWEPTPEVFRVRGVGNRLSVTVDCGALQAWHPGPESLPREIRFHAAASIPLDGQNLSWDAWSSTREEMGRTVQLTYFVDELRLVPDDYAVLLPPVGIAESRRYTLEMRTCPAPEEEAEAVETPAR